MFNTIIQPTGVYGTFKPAWANDDNKQAFSKFQIKDPAVEAQKKDANIPRQQKKKSPIAKMATCTLLGALGALAIVGGVPAIRDKFACFSKKELEKPAKALLGSEKLGEIAKGARVKFVDCANFIENKFQVPFREFLYENVFKFVNYYPEKEILKAGRLV